MKLQRILYIVESEYSKLTHKFLFTEYFSTWAYGPILFSIYDQFQCYNKAPIKSYAYNSQQKTLMVNEDSNPYLRAVLDDVCAKTKNIGAVELSHILQKPDSAWDKAFQEEKPILDPEDIYNDTSYRLPLGFSIERFS